MGIHGAVEPVATDELLWSLASGYVNFTEGHSSIVVAFLGEFNLQLSHFLR